MGLAGFNIPDRECFGLTYRGITGIFPYGNIMYLEDTHQLGSAIRARRRELGVTQEELAMTAGTGLRFIIDLEKGKPTCQIGKAIQVLRTLGLVIQAEQK